MTDPTPPHKANRFDCKECGQGIAGLVSINTDLEIAEGYDGGIESTFYDYERDTPNPLTRDERREIAVFMADLWIKWADQPPKEDA